MAPLPMASRASDPHGDVGSIEEALWMAGRWQHFVLVVRDDHGRAVPRKRSSAGSTHSKATPMDGIHPRVGSGLWATAALRASSGVSPAPTMCRPFGVQATHLPTNCLGT